MVSKKTIISIGAFFGLWLVIVYVDRELIGASYVYSAHDTSVSWFGIGLNWLTGDPFLWRHQPSNTVNMLSGLVVAFLSIDGTAEPLRKFIAVGTIIEGGLIFAGAAWFAWVSNILRLSLSNRLVLLFLIFCMPPAIANPGHWGMWTDFGLLAMPLGLTLVAGLKGNKKAIRVGGIASGVMAANFYPSAVISVAFFLALLWRVYPNRRLSNNQISIISKFSSTKLLVTLLGVCVAGWAFGVYFSGVGETSLPSMVIRDVYCSTATCST